MGKMSNHIKDFEKAYPTLATEFKKIQEEQYDLPASIDACQVLY